MSSDFIDNTQNNFYFSQILVMISLNIPTIRRIDHLKEHSSFTKNLIRRNSNPYIIRTRCSSNTIHLLDRIGNSSSRRSISSSKKLIINRSRSIIQKEIGKSIKRNARLRILSQFKFSPPIGWPKNTSYIWLRNNRSNLDTWNNPTFSIGKLHLKH